MMRNFAEADYKFDCPACGEVFYRGSPMTECPLCGASEGVAGIVRHKLAALSAELAEARAHEEWTHREMEAIVGKSDSFIELTKALRAENAGLKAEIETRNENWKHISEAMDQIDNELKSLRAENARLGQERDEYETSWVKENEANCVLDAENARLREALEKVGTPGNGLQGIFEDYPEETMQKYYMAYKYCMKELERKGDIARTALTSQAPEAKDESVEVTPSLIDLRNIIGGVGVIDDSDTDNLAIALACYFSDRLDRPEDDEADDETGWSKWAIEKANSMMDRVVLALLARKPAEEQKP